MSGDRFEALADYIIRESGYPKARREILVYSLRILNNTVWGMLVVACIGWMFGFFKAIMVAILATALLRMFAGGAHASTSFRCVTGGALIFSSIGFILITWAQEQPMGPDLFAVTMLCGIGLVILFLYAPADTPNKPINLPKQRRVLRLVAVVIFLGECFLLYGKWVKPIYGWSGYMGLWWQLFSLTPIGYAFVHRLDKGLKQLTLMISQMFSKRGSGVVSEKESDTL